MGKPQALAEAGNCLSKREIRRKGVYEGGMGAANKNSRRAYVGAHPALVWPGRNDIVHRKGRIAENAIPFRAKVYKTFT